MLTGSSTEVPQMRFSKNGGGNENNDTPDGTHNSVFGSGLLAYGGRDGGQKIEGDV